MKRVGFVVKVREDRIEEYRERHRNMSPEMKAALRRQGWRNYSLFIRDDGMAFGYVEVPRSLQDALDGMAGEDAEMQWRESVRNLIEPQQNALPNGTMIELQEVFYLD